MTKLQRLRDNIAALSHALTSAGGNDTDTEIIGKFTGFGGLGFVLNPLDPAKWTKSDMAFYADTERLHSLLRNESSSEKEYSRWMESLKASTLTAYYTPVEVPKVIFDAIYGMKRGMNEKGICPKTMLDPAAGMGVFGRMAKISALGHCNRLSLTSFEEDILTGVLLNARKGDGEMVFVDSFEHFPNDELGLYDLVSTNVPFGAIQVYDPAYTNSDSAVRRDASKMIHRYYVLKGLDCLRDGGLLAYIITSNYINSDTEQLREALKQARLIGAYRLANNLFKDSGTEVGTDLIVLQKDQGRGELTDAECLLLTSSTEQECPTNFYFTCYPDHVIATSREAGTDAYGKPGFVYDHRDGVKGIADQLGKVLAEDMRTNVDVDLFERTRNTASAAQTPKPKAKRQTKKEKDLSEIYDCYSQLYSYEQTLQAKNAYLRNELNARYDIFVNEYGRLNDSGNIQAVKRVANELLGLEVKDGQGCWVKADIFLKPVAFSTDARVEPMTAKEALAHSLNDNGVVNIGVMRQMTGMSESDLIDALRGEIFYNPLTKIPWEIKSKFISGDVIEKLERMKPIYEQAKKDRENQSYLDDLKASVDALTAAIPATIPFEDLDFNLGERWVDAKVYASFASDFFSMPEDPVYSWMGGKVNVKVRYQPLIDQFSVSADSHNEKIWTQYKVSSEASKDQDGIDLFTHALHNSCPKMMKYMRDSRGRKMKDESGNYIKLEDGEKTQLASTKIEEIRAAYTEWLQRQPKEFRDGLAAAYNRRFNCFVKPKYDGSFLTFPGIDMDGLRKKYGIERLYDSQKDCIWMLLLNGGGICDHEVGSGKTLIMCIAAHEMKRLGMVNKPMIIGLKANVSAIAETYQTAYPDAKILFAKEADYSASNRVDFFNRMKNNNYDCIIMSHDQFGKIPQSNAIQEELIQDELSQLEDALNAVSRTEGWEISNKQLRGLEQRKRNLKAKLEKLQDDMAEKKDDVVDFGQMGIDHIFVDESHQFKNLGFTTRHDRVAGIGNTEGSKRAFNLLMAIRTIQQRTGRDLGATFLSGTTVTNSLTELYALFRYLRPKALQKQNITCFDAWAAIFTKKSQEYEFGVTNQIQLKERFRYFIKVPELAMFYNEITDFRTAEDVGIDRPRKKAMLLNIKPTPDQEKFIKTLMKFAKTGDFSLIGMPFVTDNQRRAKMLYATDMARKMSLDMRLIDPAYGDHPNNKASRCAALIKKYYDAFSEQKGTQLVFSDLSTYQGSNGPWNVYSEIKRKLVSEYGINPGEVRFIQECKNDLAKQKMIADVNDGKIRVLFGSTSMLGTGVNAQQRVVAVHHLDTPWRPSDLEQRDGRAVRTGNEIAKLYADNKVDVIIYAVERSLDSYKFNLLHCKQTFINQLKRGQLSIRTLDEGAMDENTGMNFSEYMAILSGNTDLLDRAKLEKKIAGLESQRKAFYKERAEQEAKRMSLVADNEKHKRNIAKAKADVAAYNKARILDRTGQVVNDIVLPSFPEYSECPDYSEFVNAIGKELIRIDKETRLAVDEYKTVGTICGFPILMKGKIAYSTVSDGVSREKYENIFYVKMPNLTYEGDNYGHLSHASYKLAAEYALHILDSIVTKVTKWENQVEENQVSIDQLSSILDKTFGKETELAKLRADLSNLDKKIAEELKQNEGPQQPASQVA